MVFTDLVVDVEPPEWLLQNTDMLRSIASYGFVLNYLFAYFIGLGPAYLLIDKLKKLWPSVEFQVGPRHTFFEKRRRVWLVSVFFIGVTPFFVAATYDLLKSFVLNSS